MRSVEIPRRVFISSTGEDLRAHRAAVVDAINRLGHSAICMETFGARPIGPVSECCRLAADAHALVVIVAHRCGWIPSVAEGGDGAKSITRLEVEAARAGRVPIFVFLVDEKYKWRHGQERDQITAHTRAEELQKIQAAMRTLADFKHWLNNDLHVIRETFTTPDKLALRVATSLNDAWSSRVSARAEQSSARPDPPRSLETRLCSYIEASTRRAENRLLQEVVTDTYESEMTRPHFVVPDLAPYSRAASADPLLSRAAAQKQDKSRLEQQRLPATALFAAMATTRRLVILGGPGCGKTTLLNVLCARQLLARPWPDRIGGSLAIVQLRVRELAARSTENILSAIQQDAANARDLPECDREFFEALLAQGRVIVVIDGLDETPDALSSDRLCQQIDLFASRYEQVSIIVSSRVVGYRARILERAFQHYELAPFSPEQAHRYIQNALGSAAKKWLAPQHAVIGRSGVFARPILNDPQLSSLTDNPLMLSLIAKMLAAHRTSEDIPHERYAVYNSVIELQLSEWDRQRGVENALTPRELQASDMRRVLEVIAFRVHAGLAQAGWRDDRENTA